MVNVTKSGRKVKDDDSSSSKRRHPGGKGSTTSGSMTTDTSGLRRSARETPSKKQMASSPSNTRKSERIETRTPPTPPSKRKSERAVKQTPSPLKRSDRVEKNNPPSSSGSKKSEKSSSVLMTKKKTEDIQKNGKQPMVNAMDQCENEEKNFKPRRVMLKKRLDACSYRELLFKRKPKKPQESGPPEKLKLHDGLSPGDTDNKEASGSKEVEDGWNCSERKGEEIRREESGEGFEGAAQGSTSGSEKFTSGSPRDHEEMEICHSSQKLDDSPEEANGCNDDGGSSSASKFSDNSFPGVLAKKPLSDPARTQLDSFQNEPLRKVVELMESTSEGTSVSGNAVLGNTSTDPSKRKRKVNDLNCDASITASHKEICLSSDAISSFPLEEKKNSYLEQCVSCSKRKRLEYDSRTNVCFCNSEKSSDSFSAAPPEEVQKQTIKLTSPQNGGFPEHCRPKDGNRADEDDKRDSDHLPEAHRKTVVDELELEILNPLNEDGGQLRSSFAGPIEECTNQDTQESSPGTDNDACVICRLAGTHLCCAGNGCKTSYHLNCIDPPLKVVPLGSWHCILCVKNKIMLGVHSVCRGIESVWDSREEEVSDGEGMQKQKQYLVKYRGLAHVHNRWIPEKQLLLEAPLLITKFEKSQTVKWKPEWKKPHRLLQKRMLMSPKQRDEDLREDHSDTSNCVNEWLVKWCGLGYEHATWELETAEFFRSPEAKTLVQDYEMRRQKAKRLSPRTDKERKGPFVKLSKLPGSGLSVLDNNYLSFVNKLRKRWHTNKNAVVVEDQERIPKVVLFILSEEPFVRRPFLVVTTSSSIPLWEAEFMRVAPSIAVVSYIGNRDVRQGIRGMEFYAEGDHVMFQVLLSTPDLIIEDQETLDHIRWESIVVDECQLLSVSRHFEGLKALTTDFKLLLFSGQIKDRIAEYLNLLSFIDSEGDGNGAGNLSTDSNDSISKLKEKFSKFLACERKSDSKFLEYRVPVRLSNVQLEGYCATLISNLISLRSCTKTDPFGALRNILISCRKCCDHPYLVDEYLQSSLTKGLPEAEYLDVGVDASGKLNFFDKILSEIKKRHLRVLVLFQSIGGSVRNCIGDILDDFLRQRFGPDSYERVDSGLVTAKKQAALNMFNNKEKGRFVFLLEKRACLPSIKLCSVDLVILFDSDWNPSNDLRALQKITIDSQHEQLKVFRLYSSCTVEEKVLILAKKDMTLDSNLHNINPSIIHMLLMWGASHLFKKLDEFHGGCTQSSLSSISTKQSFLNDVLQEFLTQLPSTAQTYKTNNCSFISEVQQSGATYSKSAHLLGEFEMQPGDEELPHVFWKNLLEGRIPQWRYCSGSSQRARKKVQYSDECPKRSQVVENDEAARKRRKVSSSTVVANSPNGLVPDKRKLLSMEDGSSGTPACYGSRHSPRSIVKTNAEDHTVSNDTLDQPDVNTVELEERGSLRGSQKNLHLSLQPEVSKLCEILQLPEGVKSMAGKFLEFIMNNLFVSKASVTLLQAFQISLCWSAASLLKHKINHKESLAIAKQHLNFECKEEETLLIYEKLREQENRFSSDSLTRRIKEGEKQLSVARDSPSTASGPELEEGEIRESSQSRSCSSQPGSAKQEQTPESERAQELVRNEFSKGIKQAKKTYSSRMKKVLHKQMEDYEDFNRQMEEKEAKLVKDHNLEAAIIKHVHNLISVRTDKLKVVDQDFEQIMKEFHDFKERKHIELEGMQQAERTEEKQMKAHWLEEAKFGRSVAAYATILVPNPCFRLEQLDMEFRSKDGTCYEKVSVSSETSPEIHDPSGDTPLVPNETVHAKISSTVPCGTVQTKNFNTVSDMEVEVHVDTDRPVVQHETACPEVSGTGVSPDANGVTPIVPGETEHDETLNTVTDMEVKVHVDADRPVDQRETACGEVSDTDVSPDANGVAPISAGETEHDENLNTVSDTEEGVHVHADRPVPGEAVCAEVSSTVSEKEIQVNVHAETQPIASQPGEVDNENDTMVSEHEDGTGSKHQAGSGASGGGGSTSPEQIGSPCAQQNAVPALVGEVQSREVLLNSPLDQISTVQQLQPSVSARVEGEDASGCEMQSSCQAEVLPQRLVDNVPSNQSNDDIPLQPVNVQLQLPPSIDSTLLEHNQDEVPSCPLVGCEQSNMGHNVSEVPTQPPVRGFNQSGLPHNVQFQQGNQLRRTSSQPNEEAAHLPVLGQIGLSSRTVSLPDAQFQQRLPQDLSANGSRTHVSDPSVGIVPESIQRTPTARATSRVPSQFFIDPLYNELMRIRNDDEQTIKMHEERKMRLNSEYQKEMEEVHRKYSALLQDAEVSVMQKRQANELAYINIQKNRVLAEACRLKWNDPKTASPGQLQGGPPGFTQQLVQQMSSHQNIQHSTAPSAPPSAAPAAPPVQVVHNPSALFSTNPVRPQFSTVISPSGKQQVGSEVRAPAPHLQPFRATISVSSAISSPSMLPNQHLPSIAPTTSTLHLQNATRAPTYTPNPFSRTFQSESALGCPVPQNSSLPALDRELLMDVDNHLGASPVNLLPRLQDLGRNNDTWDMSKSSKANSSRGSAARSTATDVVYLSDDD